MAAASATLSACTAASLRVVPMQARHQDTAGPLSGNQYGHQVCMRIRLCSLTTYCIIKMQSYPPCYVSPLLFFSFPVQPQPRRFSCWRGGKEFSVLEASKIFSSSRPTIFSLGPKIFQEYCLLPLVCELFGCTGARLRGSHRLF